MNGAADLTQDVLAGSFPISPAPTIRRRRSKWDMPLLHNTEVVAVSDARRRLAAVNAGGIDDELQQATVEVDS